MRAVLLKTTLRESFEHYFALAERTLPGFLKPDRDKTKS